MKLAPDNVGPPVTTVNAASSQAESEVAPIPPAVPVVGGGSGNDTTSDTVVQSLDTCFGQVNLCRKSLGSYIVPVKPAPRVSRSWQDIVNAMDIFATLLRANPTMAADIDPDTLAMLSARVKAGKALEGNLADLVTDLKNGDRQSLKAGWTSVLAAYPAAVRWAASSTPITTAIAPVVALFEVPSADQSAATKAAAESLNATKSANRAAKATGKANTAKARAKALAPEVIPVPAATDDSGTATPSTTAPAATPATPGTVPIR